MTHLCPAPSGLNYRSSVILLWRQTFLVSFGDELKWNKHSVYQKKNRKRPAMTLEIQGELRCSGKFSQIILYTKHGAVTRFCMLISQ